MTLVRWTDERVDDMHKLVMANDRRLDRVEKVADLNQEAIQAIATTGDRRRDRSFQLWLVVLATLGTNIVVLVELFVHHAH